MGSFSSPPFLFLKNVALKPLGQRKVDLHTWNLVQGWASHSGLEEGAGV